MSNLDKIEHIVVLMMENRSFDNVLGWLYPNNPDFRGVNSSMSNPDSKGNLHYVKKGTDATMPFPDPNEPYEYVYRQMYKLSPKMPVPMTTATPRMQGFVIDYENALATAGSANDPGTIMNCFTPETLPVINGLAKAYAVCDNWFCSVPSETFPNRSFLHAATSSGNVYNNWHDKDGFPEVFINDTKTIFNLLHENKHKDSWKVYHSGIFSNVLLCQEQMWNLDFFFEHFFSFHHFKHDAKHGKLPNYTFIEPNFMCSSIYGGIETDMHPAYGVFDTGAATDARYGDNFIFDVYTALRNSPSWEKTLFIITFDEHGGCFDHRPVAPSPKAVSPDGVTIPWIGKPTNGGSGFDFSRFGVRVPAVLISPWIEQGTICHTEFDHTSVIRTVSKKWLGGRHLTARDKIANDVGEVLSLAKPRTDTAPVAKTQLPKFKNCGGKLLSPFQSALTVAAARFIGHHTTKHVDLNVLKTTQETAFTLENIWRDYLVSKKKSYKP